MKMKAMPLVIVAVMLAVSVIPVMAAPPGPTIVDVAIELNEDEYGPFYQQLDTLIAAVLAADEAVLATLTGNGQFTVFAPTDQAFLDLGGYDETNIGDLPQEFLTDVLLYHVLNGRRYAEDIVASERLRTLQRGFLFQEAGVLTDNLDRTATIIATDVEAANGVIHAIDAVVLPYAP
jgi:uncharacterized surface protein with fasciclin (FAS1) repeats